MENAQASVLRVKIGRKAEAEYLFQVFEIELEMPDHNCGPDCECWKRAKHSAMQTDSVDEKIHR